MKGAHQGCGLLVVEDDEELRIAMIELLEEEGYEAVGARNGAEALDFLRSAPAPCLILLDLMMPVMSGDDFRTAQLGEPTLAGIPVVLLTASHGGRETAERLGVQAYFAKPIRIEKLVETVGQYC